MSDQELLAGYVDVWWGAVHDFVALLEQVPDEQWTTPTDLPGWDVRACAAHVAHLESVLAGNPEETADVGDAPHAQGLLGGYTEIGVVNRRDHAPSAILAEIREVTARRHDWLLAHPPTDARAVPEIVFGGLPWPWATLLRNRPLDVWMHEQDVRRAVGLPGGLDSPAARHTAGYLADSLGFVLAKRLEARPGTSVVLEMTGSDPVGFVVDDAGRGRRLDDVPADPTLLLRMDRETFVLLAGGRRPAAAVEVEVVGDESLGGRLLGAMATTP